MSYLTELNRARHLAGMKPLSEEQSKKLNKAGPNYEQLHSKMDKFMPEDEELADEYYEMLYEKDKKGLVSFFYHYLDSESAHNYGGKGATVEGFVDYLLSKQK